MQAQGDGEEGGREKGGEVLMFRFLDGPAAGQELACRSGKILMRAVVNRRGVWDALDQPEDEPRPDEIVYVYVAVPGTSTAVCIRAAKGMGGFYQGADYRILVPQPEPDHVRTRAKWLAWCETNRETLLAFHRSLKP